MLSETLSCRPGGACFPNCCRTGPGLWIETECKLDKLGRQQKIDWRNVLCRLDGRYAEAVESASRPAVQTKRLMATANAPLFEVTLMLLEIVRSAQLVSTRAAIPPHEVVLEMERSLGNKQVGGCGWGLLNLVEG